ncbi:hypothetical protein QBC34DRAFT_386179 [Podospora aff. communis PSN243]|uniref:Lysine-specific metallo-endopeptidase domain-containing protein n=1 Tax=Podospora aff. communis PSN243 TaxID=3040156 RepID=A0AAV9G8K1_9PEZI|nr:hypothetical protein QBC34DRAFT_386179 [Podospora aff. communis PSN243]
MRSLLASVVYSTAAFGPALLRPVSAQSSRVFSYHCEDEYSAFYSPDCTAAISTLYLQLKNPDKPHEIFFRGDTTHTAHVGRCRASLIPEFGGSATETFGTFLTSFDQIAARCQVGYFDAGIWMGRIDGVATFISNRKAKRESLAKRWKQPTQAQLDRVAAMGANNTIVDVSSGLLPSQHRYTVRRQSKAPRQVPEPEPEKAPNGVISVYSRGFASNDTISVRGLSSPLMNDLEVRADIRLASLVGTISHELIHIVAERNERTSATVASITLMPNPRGPNWRDLTGHGQQNADNHAIKAVHEMLRNWSDSGRLGAVYEAVDEGRNEVVLTGVVNSVSAASRELPAPCSGPGCPAS